MSCSQSLTCAQEWVASVDASATEHVRSDPRQSCMGKYGEFVRRNQNVVSLGLAQPSDQRNMVESSHLDRVFAREESMEQPMLLAPKCEAQKCFNNSESVYNLYNNKIAA